jgi:signal peptidase II
VTGQEAGEASPAPATEQARPRPRWGLLAAVAGAVLVVDQLTKWWATTELADGHSIDLVWSLRFRLTRNFGSAFSLGQGRGALISLLAIAVVAVLLRSGRHATRPVAALALGLVLGGAVGNLTDRAFRAGDGFLGGGVVDFIDLQWWPVFNVADMGVVCGAVLLVFASWREEADGDGAPQRHGNGGAAGGVTSVPPRDEP